MARQVQVNRKGRRQEGDGKGTDLSVLWGSILVNSLYGGDECAGSVLQHRSVEGLQEWRVVVHVQYGNHDLLLQPGVAVVLAVETEVKKKREEKEDEDDDEKEEEKAEEEKDNAMSVLKNFIGKL